MLIASYFNLKRKRPESRWTGLLKNISRNVHIIVYVQFLNTKFLANLRLF